MRQVTIITNAEMIRVIKRHVRREGLTAAALARAIGRVRHVRANAPDKTSRQVGRRSKSQAVKRTNILT